MNENIISNGFKQSGNWMNRKKSKMKLKFSPDFPNLCECVCILGFMVEKFLLKILFSGSENKLSFSLSQTKNNAPKTEREREKMNKMQLFREKVK